MTTVQKIIIATDGGNMPDTPLSVVGEYEDLLAAASDEYEFDDFDEDAPSKEPRKFICRPAVTAVSCGVKNVS